MESFTKSILRPTQTLSNSSSWFSKLSNSDTTPQLFRSFGKPLTDQSIDSELKPACLRRVRFPVTDMTTEYIFRRDDLVSEKVIRVATEPIQIKTCAQLLSLYEMICQQKQEPTMDALVGILVAQPEASCLTRLDLSNQYLDQFRIKPLCDLLLIDFGLRELVLNDCGLEDDTIKILAHSLLYQNITHLSLANNTKLTSHGFRYLSIYLKQSTQLTHLDLSWTQPDKKSLQYLTTAMSSPLNQLILDGCSLKPVQLEILAQSIRNTSLRHLSMKGHYRRLLNQQSMMSIGVMLRDYDSGTLNGLSHLTLDCHELDGYGMQYITQALKRNRQLQSLSMRECKIDAKSCRLLGEALRYNQHLQQLDLARNPLCLPDLNGIVYLAQALNVNTSLRSLCLAETDLQTEAVIALAESLPQNKSLVRLDLSKSYSVQMAGFMALVASIQLNQTIAYVDIHTPENEDMMILHHQLLAKCTQNAQSNNNNPTHLPLNKTQATAGWTLEERLAAVTRNEVRDTELIQQAIDYAEQLEQATRESTSVLMEPSKQCHALLCAKIPQLSDASHLDIMLATNDRLTTAIQAYEKTLSPTFEIGDDE